MMMEDRLTRIKETQHPFLATKRVVPLKRDSGFRFQQKIPSRRDYKQRFYGQRDGVRCRFVNARSSILEDLQLSWGPAQYFRAVFCDQDRIFQFYDLGSGPAAHQQFQGDDHPLFQPFVAV